MKVAYLYDGPRKGDYVGMSWIPQGQRIFRGDTIRVTHSPRDDTWILGQPTVILRYQFTGSISSNGAYIYTFVEQEPDLCDPL